MRPAFIGVSGDWVLPFKAREAGEVGIGGVEDKTPLDGEGGEMGISGEIASRSECFQHGAKGLEM